MAKKKSKSKSSRASLEKSEPSCLTTRGDDEIQIQTSTKTFALLKLCRLCESKDGPFLSIFEDEKSTAKKMDELLPFSVSEKDGLPHKICFRCSAKVEEFYEFVQRCKKSQKNLQTALGINTALIKHNTRLIWEEKLIKSNMSNDDICEKIVKKAMEDMRDSKNMKYLGAEEEFNKLSSRRQGAKRELKHLLAEDQQDDTDDVPLKQIKLQTDKQEEKTSKKSSRSSITTEPGNEKPLKVNKTSSHETAEKEFIPSKNLLSFDYDDNGDSSNNSKKETDKNKVKATINTEKDKDKKPFDIMDHVSTIKVNGVGILFQCKLCNRNFLKKEVVVVHGCAKTGVPKVDLTRHATPPPEPPKIPTVKYINTKTDGDLKRVNPTDMKSSTPNPDELKASTGNAAKPKPRIGPASRVRKDDSDSNSSGGMVLHPRIDIPPTLTIPSINANLNSSASSASNVPFSLNSRYKLVPGPNNTISLVEENTAPTVTNDIPKKPSKKSKHHSKPEKVSSKPQKNEEVIELDDNEPIQGQNSSKPYPINFFKSPQMSSMSTSEMHETIQTAQAVLAVQAVQAVLGQGRPKSVTEIPTPHFTTPAMKKQSYTIVQTGNPSKLLISTKPPPAQNTTVPTPEAPKRKTRKSKHEAKTDEPKQPFNVTIEEATPPKNAGFFTYVNVDPLLEPTYGIPVDKIIQESQISTSTSEEKARNIDGKYNCNMCSEVFSREKKLLTHIQAHYSKMDEEDQMRSSKTTKPKRRSKRST